MLKIVLYSLSFVAYLGCLSLFPSFSSIILLFSSILLLPVDEIQSFLCGIFKVKNVTLKNTIAVILLFIGILLTPVNNTQRGKEQQHRIDDIEILPTPTVEQTDTSEYIVEPTIEPVPTDMPVESNTGLTVTFIDVGQGDSTLIECDGKYMLIDGGTSDNSSRIYSFLKRKNISNIEILVASHADSDHIGGLAGALNYATANIILCPITNHTTKSFESFKKYADLSGVGITIPNVNDTYELGGAEIVILGVNSSTDSNNSSIILKILYGETSFLFTGDAEREAEQVVLSSGADLSATVLKVGHHGSENSTTYPFLREIMPKYAVISVGDNNHGHPTEAVLSKLRDADVQVYRTDLNGDIICTSNGKEVNFSVEIDADINTMKQ